jgi:hypothetical protein
LKKKQHGKALKVFHSSLWNIVKNSSINLRPIQKKARFATLTFETQGPLPGLNSENIIFKCVFYSPVL